MDCDIVPPCGRKLNLLWKTLKKTKKQTPTTPVYFASLQVLVRRREELLLFLLYPGEEEVAAITTPGTTFSVSLPVSLSLLCSLCFDLRHVDRVWTIIWT